MNYFVIKFRIVHKKYEEIRNEKKMNKKSELKRVSESKREYRNEYMHNCLVNCITNGKQLYNLYDTYDSMIRMAVCHTPDQNEHNI